jgi:hypothetical protein
VSVKGPYPGGIGVELEAPPSHPGMDLVYERDDGRESILVHALEVTAMLITDAPKLQVRGLG